LDCHEYDKDSKIKKSFGKGQRGSTASNNKTAIAFAQLLAKVAKVVKANEKLEKSLHKTSAIMTATAMTLTPLDGVGPTVFIPTYTQISGTHKWVILHDLTGWDGV
jgi:hypothetical protein